MEREGFIAYISLGIKLFCIQCLILFIPIFALALAINFFSGCIEACTAKSSMGKWFYYAQAPGTALHELGHAFFAVIFGYTITEFVPFVLNPKEGFAGRVSYQYSKDKEASPLFYIASFFIGVAPIILGSIAIIFLTYLFWGNEIKKIISLSPIQMDIHSLAGLENYFVAVIKNAYLIFTSLFFSSKVINPLTWLYFFLVYTIGSSITLSKQDCNIKAIWGLVEILLGLCMVNLIFSFLGDKWLNFSLYLTRYNHILYSFLLIVILLQLTTLLACSAIVLICDKKTRK